MADSEPTRAVFLSKPVTALPSFCYKQDSILEFMKSGLSSDSVHKRQLISVYGQTEINTRYSVLSDFANPGESWFVNTPLVEKRMEVYDKEAFEIGKSLIQKVTEQLGLGDSSLSDVTHLVWVSCTGMSAPGIELRIRQAFPFREDLETTAFNFLGCHGFFHALRFASGIVKSDIKANVLILCVELCTLHFQNNDSKDQLLANAIFADGGAATVVSGHPIDNQSIKIEFQKQFYFQEGQQSMGWNVSSRGFNMILSSDLPKKLKSILNQTVDLLLTASNNAFEDIHYWICHPGGKKILDAVESTFDLNPNALQPSRKTMNEVGNVSSASILFVLKKFLESIPEKQNRKGIMLGIGPGLSLETAVFKY